MDEQTKYFLLRRKKKIRIVDLSNGIGASPGWISRYETRQIQMNDSLVKKYKNYIENA